MIIDADTHISPAAEGGKSIETDELLRRMDRSKVDKAVTWLHPPYMREIQQSNEYIYKAMKRHPDRILGFGWADPHLGIENSKDMVKRCIYEYGFYGVKLNGAQNNFYIDDPVLSMPIIEEIARTGKVLAFHVGADSYEHTHPFRVAKIARQFPELQILMVHMGGAAFEGISDAAIEAAREHENLTLIGSAVRTGSILKAIRILGSSRVCFGSDTPFEAMHVEVAKYKAMLEQDFSEREKADVMSGNISRLFHLKC